MNTIVSTGGNSCIYPGFVAVMVASLASFGGHNHLQSDMDAGNVATNGNPYANQQGVK